MQRFVAVALVQWARSERDVRSAGNAPVALAVAVAELAGGLVAAAGPLDVWVCGIAAVFVDVVSM